MAERGLTKNQVVTELTKSPHGALAEYITIGRKITQEEPEFIAHLIAWNEKFGQIRDSKVALPIITLSVAGFNGELADNSLAHLALLDPRNLIRAIRFGKEIHTPNHGRAIRRMAEKYLRAREAKRGWWDRTSLQHRGSMKELYALNSIKPGGQYENVVLFGRTLEGAKMPLPKGSVFEAVARLKSMASDEAAGTILTKKIPFLVAVGALGKRISEPDMVLALINRMTAAEIVTNTKMLERLGVKTNPALRSAYEEGLKRVAESKDLSFKATRAAEAIDDEGLKAKLQAAQDKQIQRLGGIEGNWLVLGDKSSSMQEAIEGSKVLAATLARMVKGKVHLVFFDTSPRYVEATGKEYDKLIEETKHVRANGATSIGCGLMYALEKGIEVDGIAVVSDGAENSAPMFGPTYRAYCEKVGKTVPVYLYWAKCYQPSPYNNNPDALATNMESLGLDLQVFDLRGGFDYYSLPNIAQTMKTQRYGLVEQIMETPLLRLADVFQ